MKSFPFFSIISMYMFAGLIALMISIPAKTQHINGNDGYFFIPGPAITLPPGGQTNLFVKYAPVKDSTIIPIDAMPFDVLSWNVNGHDVLSLTPTDGNLSVDFTETKATYTAPAGVPEKNPIAISVTLKSPTGKGTIILICNITVLKAQYKITMDAENTVDNAGKDIKLHGECYANLKALEDGTLMLAPVDKTRNMNVFVEKGEMVNADGATGKLTTPMQYTFPFLFSIGKMGKGTSTAQAIVYLNSTAPEKGIVTWLYTGTGASLTTTYDIDKGTVTNNPGQTIQMVPKGNNTMFAMGTATGLDLLPSLMGDQNIARTNNMQNLANANDQKAFAERMRARMNNDPAYFKTAQGKADLQRMASFNQQVGGNIENSSSATKNMDADIANKIKNNPDYARSGQLRNDINNSQTSIGQDKFVYQKDAMAQVTPGTAKVRIEGSFNAKSGSAFTGQLESSIGPMKTTIKISVEKISN